MWLTLTLFRIQEKKKKQGYDNYFIYLEKKS